MVEIVARTAETRALEFFSCLDSLMASSKITRTQYLHIKREWSDWLRTTRQRNYSPSIGEAEMAAMTFIDYLLSQDEKEQASAYLSESQEGLMAALDQVVDDGYRVAFTYDTKNKCVMVTLIGKTTANPNFDRAMTTRHKDVQTALRMALFKHNVVFESGSWGSAEGDAIFG